METFRTLIGPDEGADTIQLCIRAALLFAFGLICIRIAGRRTFSNATPLDIIVALIVGSNISRVMTGKADVWPVLSATLVLVALHRLLAMLSLRWSPLARWLKCEPVVLVRDGLADHRVMSLHGIGEADLMEGLRLEQVETVADVRLATLEGGGRISVVPRSAPGDKT